MTGKFDVTGMTCSACSAHVEKSVSKLNGVGKVNVNLLTNSMQVEYNEELISEDNIINAVVNAGYGASVKGSAQGSVVSGRSTDIKTPGSVQNVYQKNIANMKKRLIVSIIFLKIGRAHV